MLLLFFRLHPFSLKSDQFQISNFPCSHTRNITSHSMTNLTFHSLLRWRMIILPIHTTSLGECTVWTWDWKGQMRLRVWCVERYAQSFLRRPHPSPLPPPPPPSPLQYTYKFHSVATSFSDWDGVLPPDRAALSRLRIDRLPVCRWRKSCRRCRCVPGPYTGRRRSKVIAARTVLSTFFSICFVSYRRT